MQYKQIGGNRQNLPKAWTLKDGSQTGNFDLLPEAVHNDEGWYQCLDDPIVEIPATHKLGVDTLIDNKWQRFMVEKTQEEKGEYSTTLREEIISNIYNTASVQSDQLSNNYSVTEAVRWTEDRAAIAAGNWSHFDDRSGSLTGQVYAETRVIPKITAGNIFLDKVIAKRTNLILALDGTLDADLGSFDYTTMWDEKEDYTPPPVEEVSTGAWDGLMASIPFNIKLW